MTRMQWSAIDHEGKPSAWRAARFAVPLGQKTAVLVKTITYGTQFVKLALRDQVRGARLRLRSKSARLAASWAGRCRAWTLKLTKPSIAALPRGFAAERRDGPQSLRSLRVTQA
jgi:hypothetical protein